MSGVLYDRLCARRRSWPGSLMLRGRLWVDAQRDTRTTRTSLSRRSHCTRERSCRPFGTAELAAEGCQSCCHPYTPAAEQAHARRTTYASPAARAAQSATSPPCTCQLRRSRGRSSLAAAPDPRLRRRGEDRTLSGSRRLSNCSSGRGLAAPRGQCKHRKLHSLGSSQSRPPPNCRSPTAALRPQAPCSHIPAALMPPRG